MLSDERIQLVICEELLSEIREVSSRPKFIKYFPKEEVESLIEFMQIIGERFEPTQNVKLCRDEADDYLLALAMEKAIAFLQKSENFNSNMRKASRKTPQLVLANNCDEFYVFNDKANGGYVIVSGDERTPDVLGYSDDGHYDSRSVPIFSMGIGIVFPFGAEKT